MNILFLHRGFPGQFKYLAVVLAQQPNYSVSFITADEKGELNGINKLVYKVPPMTTSPKFPIINSYEEAVLHGQAAARVAITMKKNGYKPDIIIGHSWGTTLFMKDVFPDVPLLCYFEWFENAEGSSIGFDGNKPDEGHRAQIRASNAAHLIDLASCDAGLSPTEWQKSQFPKEFHHKIKVIHDGIDVGGCSPNKDAKFIIKDKNIELTTNDEVITYATRGMEPYRGFPQFMEAVEKLQKKRPNAHFVIGGIDKTFYGDHLEGKTYKEIMLKKLNLDMTRVHFVGELSFFDYINLLQVSSVHVYATVPFVLSWSCLEAMSVGCCIVASNTAPVQEVLKDNYSALMYDFYNVDQMVEKIEYALEHKDEMQTIRNNARQTVIDNYAIMNILPKQVEYINSLVRK